MVKIIEIQPHTEEMEEMFTFPIRVFLAGSIDMGNAEDWQRKAIQKFRAAASGRFDIDGELVIYNPRRNSGEGFTPDNKEEMEYQVNWELDHLEKADFIIMNLLPDSKSPISLMELGLFASSGKLIVACPPEFYRYDNVRIVCDRYEVPLYNDLETLLERFPNN